LEIWKSFGLNSCQVIRDQLCCAGEIDLFENLDKDNFVWLVAGIGGFGLIVWFGGGDESLQSREVNASVL